MAFLAVGASDRLGHVVNRRQVLVGSLAPGRSADAAVKFLTRYGFVSLSWPGVT
ncbi:hypothetical protein GA0074696_2834 [Micromonospora purpureochromogenes]|uniref:Uncharacterized protein n=1 Tax=Micromonospora purpureochromogenes TaxID=47872 RepID=A0A1C4XTK7_9ACTN|nr:hypothetical protein [Micromonospora purpureochromogenes]SCF11800.1 hypothetical protein GA0074696_2834 [Micromonospora purpureochromogenes]